ncbi:hypothetical protein [Geomonas subterranea]|uniref:hypothetical protein n=1 Tax=Geomonas subterranea TaxID=2847989 RepID=UPI001CD64858|nr:hypothetical protein [Geomonas fuzhouensis]
MKQPYELYTSRDGLWRARFSPKIAEALGPAQAYFVAAPSQKTAREIARTLVSHALLKLKPSRG